MGKTKTYKGSVHWHTPGRKRPIAYSTVASSETIEALSENGNTFREILVQIKYDQDIRNVLEAYIAHGFGDYDLEDLDEAIILENRRERK